MTVNEQYSVTSVTEAQHIALNLEQEFKNVLQDKDDSLKQGRLLYATLMQAANAWKFILDNLLEPISRETALNYLNSIRKGIEYLESSLDNRLVRRSLYFEDDIKGMAEELFYI